mgnify:CR=1 FL=1
MNVYCMTAMAALVGFAGVMPPAQAEVVVSTSSVVECTIEPGNVPTANGCMTPLPGFDFHAIFVLTNAPPSSYQIEWSITSLAGYAPVIVDGCTSLATYCELTVFTNSGSDTRVKVQADVYEMPAHTLVESGDARARAPCTTISHDPNHPRPC